MAQDHNDIYSIVERLRILEEGLTPVNVKHGLNTQQKSVNQLDATFKPKTVAVLTAKKDPKNPMGGKLVGDSVEDDREPVEEAVANEDVLEKVKSSLTDYLKSIEDKYKDADLKDKKKNDGDLKDKVKQDLDLIAKELDEEPDPAVIAQNAIADLGPIFKTDATGQHVDVSKVQPAGMGSVGNPGYKTAPGTPGMKDMGTAVPANPTALPKSAGGSSGGGADLPKGMLGGSRTPVNEKDSAPVKTITNECGLWEIHGNEPSGFEIRLGNRPMKSRFKSIDEAVMALEMFAARKKAQDESADYIEEA